MLLKWIFYANSLLSGCGIIYSTYMKKIKLYPKISGSAWLGLYVVVLIIIQTVLNLFYTGLLNTDEIEHIHASWLVWSGKVPYTDFFEHHNPLLWYLFAPITGLMFDNINVYYVSRCLTFAAVGTSWWFIYKIMTRWFGVWQSWLAALLLFCCSDYVSRNFVEFRPDAFMNLCLWSGLYYYFCYFNSKKTWQLSLSFIFFTLSFFFLQKIILLLFILGVFTLYQLFRRRIKPSDFCKALIIPFFLGGIFILWLTLHQMLPLYFKLNYGLNSLIPEYYGYHLVKFTIFGVMLHLPFNNGWGSVFFSPADICLCGLAVLCYPFFLQRRSIYASCLMTLFFGELFIRLFTFSPYAHYFPFLDTLAAIIIAGTLLQNFQRWKKIICNIIFSGAAVILAGSVFSDFTTRHTNGKLRPHLETMQYIIKQTAPDECILNGTALNFNLFRPDCNYVWFMLNDIGYIYEINYAEKLTDLDALLQTKRPAVINIRNYTNTVLSERRAKKLFEYNADITALYRRNRFSNYKLEDLLIQIPQQNAYIYNKELIEKYYRPTDYEPLWILKDEYRNHK